LKPELQSPAAALKLLREAWVTGSLEHPNVLPVYDVALDDTGSPLIVLKNVEGVAWSALLRDPEMARAKGGTDPLELHLDILMQVCRAVHFAHSRGVVHRDIKPDNVMIGAFGEVYLVDWGIAVSLLEDPSGRLPLASAARGLAGTPAYMCPEMLDPEKRSVSERSDVYLLGAVLHEIATGRPPHLGDDRASILESIELSKPAVSQDVPAELRHIIERAMQPHPKDRFESAEELRLALSTFLRHRGSIRLAVEAEARVNALIELIARPDVTRDQLYKLFGEARFAFQEALRSWPDNEQAQASLRKLFETMIEYELAASNAKMAASLLAELDAPRDDLRERVEQTVARDQKRLAELSKLERELDPKVGQHTRRIVGVILGASWTLAPLSLNYVDPSAAKAMTSVVGVALLVLAIVIWYLARAPMAETAVNRRIMMAIVIGMAATLTQAVVSQLSGLPPRSEVAMNMVTAGAILALMAAMVERKLWPMAPVYWVGGLLGATWRDGSPWLLSACNLALTIYVFAIWRPATQRLRSG
ncbi:MAG TPA: serine/threonine-protein kinase, partial [Polyangiaceae bacterium]|nr:serine/threonine-protein kinase [Polyangiaceae bacterium]